MLLKAFNRTLINDREKTYLTAAAASSTSATQDLTVAAVDSNAWADDDFVIVGEIGSSNAEIVRISAAVSDGTSLTISRNPTGADANGLRYAHALGEPIYRVDYNRVEFNQNTTNTSSGVTVLTTIEIQPDNEFTRYEDTANTTGYGFVRFNNQVTSAFSSYSDGVNYEASGESSSYDPRTLFGMRRRVRKLLNEDRAGSKLIDRDIDEALNDKQRDVAHQRLWSFYEFERSFAAVANQFAYDLPATVMKDHTVSFDTQPVIYVPRSRWNIMHWDTNSTASKPTHFSIWNNQIKFWPRPSTAAQTTTLNGALTATATSVTVTSTTGFNRGDYYRFIVDSEVIYATASTSTTFTGLLRGQESTTAASHSNAATVTERDIVYTGHVEPADLIDAYDRTAVREPDILCYGAAIDLAPGLEKQDLVDRFERKYTTKMKELESKYSVKQTSQFGRIRNSGEVLQENMTYLDQNRYPRDLT